ncbi:MAG TPA: glycosyltransferase [Steroidobacteraceae bacterium]|nr:glycosyltransferase [Steroidobacteraceae bacterium]
MEQVVLELAKRVRSHGVKMDVAHVAAGLVLSQDSVDGVDVYRLPLVGNRFVGWARSLGALARGYDLLHVHDPQLLALSGNVRWRCGRVPAVLSTHGGFWHTKNNYLFKRAYEATLLRSYAGHYRRVLASSVGDLDYFKGFVNRIALCSNGVAVKRFNTVTANQGRSIFKWIYWGRLSRNKRLDLAIEYVGHARRLACPVELLICGKDFDGLLPELHAQVRRLGLGDAVTFEAYLDDSDLGVELAQRGVYITASEYEGFGLGIVEAMAAGLIVTCRDMVPVNSFFVHKESGWLLRFDGTPDDIQALNELLHITAPKANAMSAAARAAASVHDWDAVTPRFVEHYREVLAE